VVQKYKILNCSSNFGTFLVGKKKFGSSGPKNKNVDFFRVIQKYYVGKKIITHKKNSTPLTKSA